MASGYGMKSHVLWNFQDNYGTSQTTSLQAIPVTGVGLEHTIEQLQEQGMYSRFGESPYHEGKHQVQGDISLEAHPISIGWPLKSVVGLTSTTSATGIQTHIFDMRTSDFDDRAAGTPATIEVHRDVGSAALYYDCVGNNLTFNIANGELLTLTAGFVGAGFSRKAAGSPTYPVAAPFNWAGFSGSYNGASIVDLKDISVSINNNLEPSWTLVGCRSPYRIKRTANQQIEISGTFTFAQHSYWQAFDAQSEAPLVLTFTGLNAPNVLKFDFPSLRFKTFNPTLSGTGLIEASFTGQAVFNVNSNSAMKITLINTQTYY